MLKRLRLVSLICVVVLVGGCGDQGDNGDAAEDDGDTPPVEEEPVDDGTDDAEPEQEPEAVTYEVQEGDNLTSIAARFDTTVEAIVEENGLDDPDAIVAGEELTIPAAQALTDEADGDVDDGAQDEEADADVEGGAQDEEADGDA